MTVIFISCKTASWKSFQWQDFFFYLCYSML